MKHLKHHETVIIRCDDIGARCGDVGARCGDVCVWGSDVGDRAEVIRCDDIGSRCETSSLDAETLALGAATSAIARSYQRYRRGVSGDIGDCGVGITPQMCNRVTNHGDMSTFSKPALIAVPIAASIGAMNILHCFMLVETLQVFNECFNGFSMENNSLCYDRHSAS